jgi:hypothetical protein
MWHAWEGEESVQCFGGKTRRNEVTRCRWENGIRMDLRVIDLRDVEWIQLAQERGRWRAFVNTVMHFLVLPPRR